jgi:murein DD-endopeptidase MepM/ murein hydrolase activator NlpD
MLDLLSSVASAERVAGAWRGRTAAHPFGMTAAGRVMPVQKYRITSFFMATDPAHTGGVHSGVDFAADEGTRIVAVCSGTVVRSGWMGAAGNAAVVRTGDGHQVLYGHMNKNEVAKGDQLRAGDPVGLIGSTGNSTGPHLHLQVNNAKGKLVDPVAFLGASHREVKQYGRK